MNVISSNSPIPKNTEYRFHSDYDFRKMRCFPVTIHVKFQFIQRMAAAQGTLCVQKLGSADLYLPGPPSLLNFVPEAQSPVGSSCSNSPFFKSPQQFDISSHRQPLPEAIMRNKYFTDDRKGTWIKGLMPYPVHRKGIENLILSFLIFPFPSAMTHLL